jgi:hypothetical protein
VRVLDLGTGEVRATLAAGADVASVVFPGNGSSLAFATAKGRVVLWSWETGDCHELVAHQGRVERNWPPRAGTARQPCTTSSRVPFASCCNTRHRCTSWRPRATAGES